MNTTLNIFKCAALTAFIVLCVYLAAFAHSATKSVAQLSSVVTNINKTLDEVNRPCSQHESCGTLADLNRTLSTVRGAVGQVEVAARHENANLTTLDAQEKSLYQDLHTTLLDGQITLNRSSDLLETSRQTMQGLQPVINESQIAVEALQTDLGTLHTLISDPALPATLHQFQIISENTASATGHLDGASKDAQTWIHGVLHPKWWQTTLTYAENALHAVL